MRFIFLIKGKQKIIFTYSKWCSGYLFEYGDFLEQSSYNGRFNLIYKHNLGGISAETSVGGFYLRKQREYATEFFTIDYVGSTLDLNGNANNLLNNIWALNDPTGAFLFGTFQEENQFDSTIEKSGA